MRDTSYENSGHAIAGEIKNLLAETGLRYVSDNEPGITRVRRGKSFRYVGPSGKSIRDQRELQRIASLAIPPAYENVWICVHARGHLQATGRDARGRKQYRYHPEWRASRDCAKFERIAAFGTALPKLRRQLKADLALPGLPCDKVLAVIVSLLDRTRVRIGNAEYARTNKSFGLTTLQDRHFKWLRGRALFRFRGKGGVEHEVPVDDRRLADIVHRCQELPGQRLFQFVDEAGEQHAVDSTLVNEYLQRVMGRDFTAKDFRTWTATVRAIELLSAAPLPQPPSERACKTAILAVIRQVAEELRNTPAVCRKSYINPIVFTAWRDGRLHRLLRGRNSLHRASMKPASWEKAALAFLRKCGD